MYERFTDRARKALTLANQEALRFNHENVGPAHILLGLIKEGSGVAAHALLKEGLNLRAIREEIEKTTPPGKYVVEPPAKLPYTPNAKKCVEDAMEEAKTLKHNFVGTEHILLGLCRPEQEQICRILSNLKKSYQDIRDEILNLLGHYESTDIKPREELPDTESMALAVITTTLNCLSPSQIHRVVTTILETHLKSFRWVAEVEIAAKQTDKELNS